jgi:hypothetical protein
MPWKKIGGAIGETKKFGQKNTPREEKILYIILLV